MILSSYYRSTAAYRVRIALALKGLEHEIKPVNLLEGAHRSSDYTANNPDGLVPTLHVENQYLGQSMAILEYLEETYPETPILPNTPLDRAYVRSISQTIASDMHPLNNLRVLKYLQQDLDVSESAKTDWYHHWLKQGFMAIEQKLQSSNKSGLCVYRDSPGLADVCLIRIRLVVWIHRHVDCSSCSGSRWRCGAFWPWALSGK